MSDQAYKLSSSKNETFTNRVDSVFGCLDSLEQKHCEAIKDFEPIDDDSKEDNLKEKCDENAENSMAIKRCNGKKRSGHWMPDFVANPAKWKKYSLEEDGSGNLNQDLSPDQLNTKVAMDFMEEIKGRNKSMSDSSEACDSIVFKKPSLLDDSVTENKNLKSLYRSAHGARARCMETFEFGNKGKCGKSVDVSSKSSTHNDKCSNDDQCRNAVSLDFEKLTEVIDEEEVDDNKFDDNSEKKTFINKGKKKNRVIRKRISDSDD